MRAYHCPRAWLLLGCLALLAPRASRADEWFLKIDGVPGVLTEGRFAGWTPVLSAGALVCRPTNGAPGPASFTCEVRKSFDRISPALLQRSLRSGRKFTYFSPLCFGITICITEGA